MTEPKPPNEALDEQERELARVLRALPGGEPPAALDQKILRAAANAAASSRRPRSRWLASLGSAWGIGGAAAAVLALGISWQMLDPSRPEVMPRSRPVPAETSSDSAVTVDLGESQGAPIVQAPAPAADAQIAAPRADAAPAQRPVPRKTALPAAPAAAMVAPAPPPPVEPSTATGVVSADRADLEGVSAKQAEASEALEHAQLAQQQAEATAANQAREASTQAAGARASAEAADAQALRSEAKAMTPAAWLAKVRKLKADGHLREARDSLELFHQYYPQYVVPADLAPLMRE